MPKVTFYLRKEDTELWKAVEKKTELIHRILNGATNPAPRKLTERVATHSADFCKEGHPIPGGRSRCMGKGCKYS